MDANKKKDIWDKIQIVGVILIPISLGIGGFIFNKYRIDLTRIEITEKFLSHISKSESYTKPIFCLQAVKAILPRKDDPILRSLKEITVETVSSNIKQKRKDDDLELVKDLEELYKTFLEQDGLTQNKDKDVAYVVKKIFFRTLSLSRLGEIIAPLEGKLSVILNENIKGSTAIGNLISDAYCKVLNADVAIINSGSLRSNRIYPDESLFALGLSVFKKAKIHSVIRRADLYSILPFPNEMVKLKVRGKKIREMLEHGFSLVDIENGTIRSKGVGRFPQISGMAVHVDLSKPVNHRVVNIQLKGENLKDDKYYNLATNDYIEKGGDEYPLHGDKKLEIEVREDAREEVVNYLNSLKIIKAESYKEDRRIKFLGLQYPITFLH